MKDKKIKIFIMLVVSTLAICLFFAFGFQIDVALNGTGGSVLLSLTKELPNITDEAEEIEDFDNSDDQEDSENSDKLNDIDLNNEDNVKYYHIVTNSNNGGSFIETEKNYSGMEGDKFLFSFASENGYYLAWLRVGNTKIYSNEDLVGYSGNFNKNLTIHAHFKKDKDYNLEDASNELNTQLTNNGKDTSPKMNSDNSNRKEKDKNKDNKSKKDKHSK